MSGGCELMQALRSITLRDSDELPDGYPFSLPLIQNLGTLELDSPVTYLVGENGSGKSTLIEAVGLAAELPVVGGQRADQDPTLKPLDTFSRRLRLSWSKRTRRGFLFRAEDFFRFARRMAEELKEMESLKDEYDERFKDRPTAHLLTTGSAGNQARGIEDRYGRDLHARSHGESFMDFFKSRFVPEGLYLMDEPEASLSPQRQLALLGLVRDMVEQGAQFIIATHAPILMSLPGSTIYSLDGEAPERVEFDDLEHVTLTRSFLEAPERFLRYL
jgi:predicted ATPase